MPEIRLDHYKSAIFVPGELDFFPYEINAGVPLSTNLRWLKARMLFFGRICLPMEFLLFNKPLFALWSDESSRAHFDEFLSDSHLIVFRATEADLHEFVARHHKALEAGNPVVIQEKAAIQYAQRLTDLTQTHTGFVLFDSKERLENYERLFTEELRRLGNPKGVPEGFADALIREARRLTKELAPRKATVDKTDALSRGGLTRVLRYSSDNTFRRFRRVIWNFAHIMYLRNISRGLRFAEQEAQPIISSLRQLDRAVILDLEPSVDFVEDLMAKTRDRLFRLNWNAIAQAPWGKIREIVEDPNSAAQAYFQARTNLVRNRTSGDLQLLVSALDEYLSYLQEVFSPNKRLAQTTIRIADWGRYVGVGVIAWKLRNDATRIWIPIAVLSAQWAASRAWKATREAWSTQRVKARKVILEQSVRQRFYEPEM